MAFTIYRGEDKTVVFTIYQADSSEPENVTGWTIQFLSSVEDEDGETQVITKTANLDTPASGIVSVDLDSSDTADIVPSEYRYTLRRTGAGVKTVLAEDTMKLRVAPEWS